MAVGFAGGAGDSVDASVHLALSRVVEWEGCVVLYSLLLLLLLLLQGDQTRRIVERQTRGGVLKCKLARGLLVGEVVGVERRGGGGWYCHWRCRRCHRRRRHWAVSMLRVMGPKRVWLSHERDKCYGGCRGRRAAQDEDDEEQEEMDDA